MRRRVFIFYVVLLVTSWITLSHPNEVPKKNGLLKPWKNKEELQLFINELLETDKQLYNELAEYFLEKTLHQSVLEQLKKEQSNLLGLFNEIKQESITQNGVLKTIVNQLSVEIAKNKNDSQTQIDELEDIVHKTKNDSENQNGELRKTLHRLSIDIESVRNDSTTQTGDLLVKDDGYIGCYVDSWPRDLNGKYMKGNVSVDICRVACKGYRYFGLAQGDECSCGNSFGAYGRASDGECGNTCSGNPTDKCGAGLRNSVYLVSSSVNDDESHGYIGCFGDAWPRDLTGIYTRGNMTVQNCREHCAKYKYFGLSMKDTCTCSNFYGRHGRVKEENCLFSCLGAENQMCGGLWRNSIYRVPPSGEHLADVSGYIGCHVNNDEGDLGSIVVQNKKMTVEVCSKVCQGFKYFGLQGSNECRCGDSFGRYGMTGDEECNMTCAGNQTQKCGGKQRTNIYSTMIYNFDKASELISRCKKVSMSSRYSSSTPEVAIDGRYSQSWDGSNCVYTQYGVNPWWKIDFEKLHRIDRVKVWNINSSGSRLSGLTIQFSTDDIRWSNITRLTESTADSGVYTMDAKGIARFVRLLIPRAEYLHFCEVEIYGNTVNR